MPSPRFGDRVEALARVLQRLREAERERDEQSIWEWTENALDRIYRLEEDASRPEREDYFERRNAHPSGRVVAGLVWVRGLSVHIGHAELRRIMWQPTKTYVRVGDEWRETTPRIKWNGELRRTEARVARLRWPTRDKLPEPGKPELKGRDFMYDEHVAGQPLMPPLDAAQAFFTWLL